MWSSLEEITIPKNVKTISTYAFMYCSSLKTATFEGPTETISNGLFCYCSKLETVRFAEGVKNINDCAFQYCTSLKDVYLPSTIESIHKNAFKNANSSVTIHGVKGSYVETWCNENGKTFSVVTSGDDGGNSGEGGEDEGDETVPVEAAFSYDEDSKTLSFTDGTYIAEYEEAERPWAQYAEECLNIVVGDGITEVGNNAFKGFTVLESVSLPEGLKEIGAYAFYGCSALPKIDLPDTLTNMGTYIFRDCALLSGVEIPEGVVSVGNYAFYGCASITEMYIPDGVKTIGEYAFYNCKALLSVRIPASVTTLGDYCFSGCGKINKVDIADMGVWSSKFTFYTTSPGMRGNNPITAGTDVVLFQNGKKVDTLVIPEGTTVINDYAFAKCKPITGVQFPSTLTKIGSNAFSSCEGLTRISINSVINYSGTDNFLNCTNLKRIDVESLEEYLKMTGYGNPFKNGADMYIDGEKVTDIVIPESVTSFAGYPFYGCTSIKFVKFHDGFKSIPGTCFAECTGLETVILNEGITSIGSNAFANCTSLKIVNIPSTVTSISTNSFAYSHNIESLEVAEGNTSFVNDEYGALYNVAMTTLYAYPCGSTNKSYVLPATVTSLSYYPLSYCRNLESITVEEGNTKYSSDENGVLYNADKTSIVQYPIGASRSSFSVPESVTKIESYTFAGCKSLTELRIPNVTSINNYAFDDVNAVEQNKRRYKKDSCIRGRCRAWRLSVQRLRGGDRACSWRWTCEDRYVCIQRMYISYLC